MKRNNTTYYKTCKDMVEPNAIKNRQEKMTRILEVLQQAGKPLSVGEIRYHVYPLTDRTLRVMLNELESEKKVKWAIGNKNISWQEAFLVPKVRKVKMYEYVKPQENPENPS